MAKNIIIPLGGLGNRFHEAFYNLPKPLVKVYGKSIIEWVIDRIDTSNVKHIIIPYHKKLLNYNFESYLKRTYPTHDFFSTVYVKILKEQQKQYIKYYLNIKNNIKNI